MARVREGGFPELTDAQLTLLLSIDLAGTRPSILAARMMLTKSSVAELLTRAERSGFVDRQPDPVDSRGRIVRFTQTGRKALELARKSVDLAEKAFTNSTGQAFADRFRRELGAYAAEAALPSSERGAEWHAANVGRVLALSAQRFVREVLMIVHVGGHSEIGETLLTLLRNLDLGGTRLTDLAARAHMTKQSMRELVDRAEALGLVARQTLETDKRAKSIQFTATGLSTLEDMRVGVLGAEARLAQQIGPEFLEDVHTYLRRYISDGSKHHMVAPFKLAPANR